MTIFIFLVVLVVLIVVHEFGHFIVAKLCGMRVDEFGLGFPPRLFSFRTKETEYTVNLLPFGGFVRIYGEDSLNTAEVDPRAFVGQPKFKQILVLLAGIAMNLVLAWLLFSIILMQPHFVSDTEIQSGKAFFPALVGGAEITGHATVAVAVGLVHFFGSVFTLTADLSQVSGPVGIFQAVGSASQAGWQNLFSLVAVISVSLALINLVPIPALDGGRLLFVIIEAVLRRPLNPGISHIVNMVGILFLLLLMVVITAHDLYKLWA